MKIPIDNPFQYPLISLVSILVIAPVLEELIFRGIILKGFLLHYPVSKAIGYTTILFGLVHGSPPLIAGAMLSGLYFAWIYYKTRSVGTTILLHITTNLAGLFGGFLRFQLSDHSEWFNLYGRYSMLIITGSSILFILFLIQVLKRTEKEKALVF
jgi:membrane protease YdiL (CAAX protease family)